MDGTINSGRYPVRGYRDFKGVVGERASESVAAWPAESRAPKRAPNVVLMLMDDMGYSDIGPFGAEIDTPTLEEISGSGYRLTNYQTPPLCAPARAALLTGLNPHRAGFGSVPHMDPGFPNLAMELPADAPILAENFRAGGYATFMVGKWHLTPEAKMHDAADKSSWPVQRGFDRYYGCLDGLTNLFHPHRLLRDNSPVMVDEFPRDYYLTDDLTDQALDMIRSLRSNDPTKPFFLYFAQLAVHGPVQAKPADLAKYRGMYQSGWDHIRSERFRRQVALGLFAESVRCAHRNTEPGSEVTPWDELTDEQQRLFARYMEAYAAAIDNVDQNLRRLTDQLKAMGEYENTIIVFTSDNGGTAEGGADGTRSYFSHFGPGGLPNLPADWQPDVPRDPDLIGGPRTNVHYPRGWAFASNTPFRLYKGHTYAGGIRVPLLLSWPAGLPRGAHDDGVRHQYAFAADVGATLLKLAGLKPLEERHGKPMLEPDSIPFDDWLHDGALPGLHTEQYTEISGRRAYLDGRWKALTPSLAGPGWRDDEWELYDVVADPAETRNLAADHPHLVAAFAERFRAAAWHNQVFPVDDDGSMSRVRPATELRLEAPATIFPGSPTLERFRSAKLTKLRSFDIDIALDYRPGDRGVLVAHGDQGGGYVLYIENGRLCLTYNQYGTCRRTEAALPDSARRITAKFTALADVTWKIDVAADGRRLLGFDRVLQVTGFAPLTGISAGLDRGGPVDWELSQRHGCFRYNGRLDHVRYVPGPKTPYNPEIIAELEHAERLSFE